MSSTYLPQIYSSDFCYSKSSTQFSYSDNICNQYNTNTDCGLLPEDTDEDKNTKKQCELCKNTKLANRYKSLNKGNGKNYIDLKEQYKRAWTQTGNLGIGIFLLCICIYYQK
jgi:hypothetical protein